MRINGDGVVQGKGIRLALAPAKKTESAHRLMVSQFSGFLMNIEEDRLYAGRQLVPITFEKWLTQRPAIKVCAVIIVGDVWIVMCM